MEYYNPIDHSSKRYAAVITVVVMALISLGVSFVTFEIERHNNEIYAVEIEYVEELEEEPEQKTPPAARAEQTKVTNPRPNPTQAYENESKDNTRTETSGKAESTQTLNPNASFKPTKGITPDQDITEGNRLAPEGENEEHKGEGTGLNVIGDAHFDGGLQTRGVIAGYPIPKGNNASGKVVIAVVVDSEGNVTSASFRQQGSTTSDQALISNAIAAAKRTKFNPDPSRMSQTGTITYNYKVR
jgi:TonB family protein